MLDTHLPHRTIHNLVNHQTICCQRDMLVSEVWSNHQQDPDDLSVLDRFFICHTWRAVTQRKTKGSGTFTDHTDLHSQVQIGVPSGSFLASVAECCITAPVSLFRFFYDTFRDWDCGYENIIPWHLLIWSSSKYSKWSERSMIINDHQWTLYIWWTLMKYDIDWYGVIIKQPLMKILESIILSMLDESWPHGTTSCYFESLTNTCRFDLLPSRK